MTDPSHGVPHARIAATAAAVLRLRRERRRHSAHGPLLVEELGVRLTEAEVDALLDGPALRAVLCEECRTCRRCGGTAISFAISGADAGEGCHWVEPDLCSGCAGRPAGEARG